MEQIVLRAPNDADPGAVQPLTQFGAPATSSHPQQNIGTAAQRNDSATVQSVTEGGVDLGSQIENPRIAESDTRLRNTHLHLTPMINIHRAEDGLVVIRITSPDRERPTIITLRHIRPSDAVDVEFVRGDTTQVVPQGSGNNGVFQESEAPSVISQSIQGSREAVPNEQTISSRSLDLDHTSVDGGEGDEVILLNRPPCPYEVSFDRDEQASTVSGTVTMASPNAQGEEGPQCSICFEVLTTRSTLMPCGHEFDATCIIPWFQAAFRNTYPRRRTLDCPLCRQSTTLMRHTYNPQGDYQISDIHTLLRGPYDPQRWPWPLPNPTSVPRRPPVGSPNVASPGDFESTNSRDRYFLGQYGAFIIASDHPERLFLDIERVNRMGPHELEDLISDLRSHLSDADWNRLPETQIRKLVERICTFRSLSSGDPFARVNYFPGYNFDDSLNINEINIMSRQYLANFRDVLIALGEFERMSGPDFEAFQQIW